MSLSLKTLPLTCFSKSQAAFSRTVSSSPARLQQWARDPVSSELQ